MRIIFYLLFVAILVSCNPDNKPNENVKQDAVTTSKSQDTSDADLRIHIPQAKLSVLVLPPYDEIANAGISPGVQEYLEDEIAKDTNLVLIKFPYKQLMNVEIYNIYDKKYCADVLKHVKADVLIMTKLDNVRLAGKMKDDKWNLSIRIYNVNTGVQTDSKVSINNSAGADIQGSIASHQKEISAEINNSR